MARVLQPVKQRIARLLALQHLAAVLVAVQASWSHSAALDLSYRRISVAVAAAYLLQQRAESLAACQKWELYRHSHYYK